jgi:HD-GYP domain-containing protein (c-di-GMP phosphodiesterase class II)
MTGHDRRLLRHEEAVPAGLGGPDRDTRWLANGRRHQHRGLVLGCGERPRSRRAGPDLGEGPEPSTFGGVAEVEVPGGVKLSELLGVLSFGVDLGMGQPMEHVLRQCLIALDLAEQIDLGDDDRRAVFFGSLVVWVGCHVDAYEQAKWFGDEMALKGDVRRTDFHTAASGPLFMLRHLGSGLSWHQKLGLVPSFMSDGKRAAESMLENHWRAADDLMALLGLERPVRDTVEQSFERWDGRGAPKGLKADDILVTARLVNLADVVEVFYRAGGVEAAVSVARQRAGTQFDPDLVDLFADSADALFTELDAVEPWKGVLTAEPGSQYWLTGGDLDTALGAVADFCDVKSPFTIGHSRAVADLVSLAAPVYGLNTPDATLVRRAALVHDLGKLGVPNTIWDKSGPLTPAELERAHLHVYLSERMLASSSALAPLAAVAVQHHERLDGSGYPRQLTGGDITPAGRLLAAADRYRTLIEPRPYQVAKTAEQASADVLGEVRAGHLDADAVAAVLAATGHRSAKRREWPAGLTNREVEILRLLARGHTNKQIAATLTISPKTAGTHVEHIYTKLGVTNRALASLFAAKHGLITADASEDVREIG